MQCGFIQQEPFPDDRSLSQILNAAMDNLDRYYKSENLGNKFSYYMELQFMADKLRQGYNLFIDSEKVLPGIILHMVSSGVREKYEQMKKDKQIEGQEQKRKDRQERIYWTALERLAKCYDEHRVTSEDVERVRTFNSDIAKRLEIIAK